jgi:hypothetical protein
MGRNVWSVMIAMAISIVPLSSCSEASLDLMSPPSPLSPAAADAALDELVDRVSVLRLGVTVAREVTPELRGELARLKRDVLAWRARTGRNDIGVTTHHFVAVRPRGGGPGATAALRRSEIPACGCPLFTYKDGWHCFLMSWACTGDNFPTCHYECYWIFPQK